MGKKLMAALLATVLVLALSACEPGAGGGEAQPAPGEGAEGWPDETSAGDDSLPAAAAGGLEEGMWDGVELTISYGQSSQANYFDNDEIMAILADYTALTGAAFNMAVNPDDSFQDVIKVQLATGEAPDMWIANYPQTNINFNVYSNGLVMDDQPWISRQAYPDFNRDPDGHYYAFPLTGPSFFGAYYYVTDTLEEIGIDTGNLQPETFQEVLDLFDRILDAGIYPMFQGNLDSWFCQTITTAWLGCSVKDQQDIYDKLLRNEITFSEVPEFQKVFEDYVALYEAGYVNPDHMSKSYNDAYEAFSTKTCAGAYCGEYLARAIYSTDPEMEMGAFVVPFNDDDIMGCGTFCAGIYAGRGTGREDATLHFLNWFSQPEQLDRLFAVVPGLSGFTDVGDGQNLPCIEYLVDNYMLTGKYAYEFDAYFDICRAILNSDFFPLQQEMVSMQKTPAQVWSEWDSIYQQFMQEAEAEGF